MDDVIEQKKKTMMWLNKNKNIYLSCHDPGTIIGTRTLWKFDSLDMVLGFVPLDTDLGATGPDAPSMAVKDQLLVEIVRALKSVESELEA